MSERTFASNLIRLRKAAGMTQDQLAEAAGISKSYVSMLERGGRDSPSATALEGLSLALGCGPAELFQGVDLDDEDSVVNDIIGVTKSLTPERRRLALRLLKGMAEDAA